MDRALQSQVESRSYPCNQLGLKSELDEAAYLKRLLHDERQDRFALPFFFLQSARHFFLELRLAFLPVDFFFDEDFFDLSVRLLPFMTSYLVGVTLGLALVALRVGLTSLTPLTGLITFLPAEPPSPRM